MATQASYPIIENIYSLNPEEIDKGVNHFGRSKNLEKYIIKNLNDRVETFAGVLESNLINQKTNPNFSYSFDYSLRKELDSRLNQILENDQLKEITTNPYYIGVLKPNENNKIQLESKLFLNSEIDKEISITFDFLNSVTNDPNKILTNNLYRDAFKFAISKIKEYKINVKDLYKLNQYFDKKTEFDNVFRKANDVLYKISSEDFNTISSNKIINVNKPTLTTKLIKLNNEKLLEIDFDKINNAKTKESQNTEDNKNTFAQMRKVLAQSSTRKINLITPKMSFGQAIDILVKEKELENFPFKIHPKIDEQFIKEILKI